MKRSGRGCGRRIGRQLLVVTVLVLIAALSLAGCSSRRSTGASESWSGVAEQQDADAAFVGTKDGRILEVLLNRDSSGRARPSLGATFNVHDRPEGSGQQRVGVAFYGTPTIANGHVYVGSYQGFVYSLLAAGSDQGPALSSSNVGSFEIEGDRSAKGITGAVIYADGALVVAGSEDINRGRLYVLDAAKLDANAPKEEVERCRYPAGQGSGLGRMWTTPLVVDGVAYFGDLDHFVHAVDIQTCKSVWDAPAELGGAVVSTPVVLNGKLYVGAFDRWFYEIDMATGAATQLFEGGSWFWASPAVVNGKVVAANIDGILYGYEPGNGVVWQYDQEGGMQTILSSPAVVGDKVVLGSDGGQLTLLDPDGNALRRVTPATAGDKIRAPITSAGDTVFVHSLGEVVTAFTVTSDGLDQDWTYTIPKS